MSDFETPLVTRRRVFYIPGYDPIHPRRYRELYRSEVAKQGELSDYAAKVSAKQTDGSFGWHVNMHIDDVNVRADVDVLLWSDIVRDSMNQSIPATYWQAAKTSWTYIRSGALRRLMWLRKGPVIAALYPVLMLILQFFTALALVIVGGRVLTMAVGGLLTLITLGLNQLGLGLPTRLSDYGVFSFVTFAVITALQFGAFVLMMRWFRDNDNKIFAHYLMHDFAYSAQANGANPPALEERMSEFAEDIAEAFTTDVDEVLVVGHSSGAHLAISILSDLIRAGRIPADGPKLAFLSLGHVVPMVSFLPEAHRLRADLAYLSMRPEVTWVDVTAPGDGCSFALCDPVAVSGVAPEGQRWPLVLSAAFTQTLTPQRWAELRWRFFRLHFQYLCAFDNPGDYDYFQITAGPILLRDRYKGRASSQSRIDIPASKYTSMTAVPGE